MAKIRLWGYQCERCEHQWVPVKQDEKPKVCPKCKSPYWDRPRRDAEAKAKSGD
jgi:predicted Zn-ribbon and HTH transcriptional regulator